MVPCTNGDGVSACRCFFFFFFLIKAELVNFGVLLLCFKVDYISTRWVCLVSFIFLISIWGPLVMHE